MHIKHQFHLHRNSTRSVQGFQQERRRTTAAAVRALCVLLSLSLPRPLSPPEKLPYASKVTASKRWMKRSDDCNQIVLTYFTFTDSTVNIAKSNDFGRFFHSHLNASWGIDENRRRQSVVSFSSTRRRRPSKASGRGAPYAVEWSDGHKKNGGLEKPRHGMLPLRGNERGKDQRSGA